MFCSLQIHKHALGIYSRARRCAKFLRRQRGMRHYSCPVGTLIPEIKDIAPHKILIQFKDALREADNTGG